MWILGANLIGRIKNNFKVLSNAVDDPFQKTIRYPYQTLTLTGDRTANAVTEKFIS